MFYWFGVIAFIFVVSAAYGCISAAPWVPARKGDPERAIKLARISSGQSFVDLGCGDGRLVIAAARAGAKAEGYEVALLPYFIALFRAFFLPKDIRPKIHLGNFWSKDLSRFDVVYCFLMPSAVSRLKAKMEKELKLGAKVITYVWPVQGWEAAEIDFMEGRNKVYLYKR